MANAIKTQLALMHGVVISNLAQCCREVIEWQNTGNLKPDSKLKEAASHLKDTAFSAHTLTYVENYVKTAAMECVVKLSQPKSSAK